MKNSRLLALSLLSFLASGASVFAQSDSQIYAQDQVEASEEQGLEERIFSLRGQTITFKKPLSQAALPELVTTQMPKLHARYLGGDLEHLSLEGVEPNWGTPLSAHCDLTILAGPSKAAAWSEFQSAQIVEVSVLEEGNVVALELFARTPQAFFRAGLVCSRGLGMKLLGQKMSREVIQEVLGQSVSIGETK